MWTRNETEPADFTLLGFFPEFRYITAIVSIILLIYTAAITGNTLLIFLIWLDSRLHTPMYFLLSQLSLMDLTLTSSIVPKMAANFFSGWQSISFLACGTQIFFSLTVAIAECILITLMCFDRYVAICNPLRYSLIISPSVCLQMAAISWAGGALTSLGHTAFTLHFHICNPREIPHFFCEVMAVLRIVCEDISAYEKAVVVTSILVLLLPLSLILSSYILIFLTVLRMNSPEVRAGGFDEHHHLPRLDFAVYKLLSHVDRLPLPPEDGLIAAVMGNAVLILLIWLDTRLHSPMYFLLSQLSLIDLALISTTVPKMVSNFFSGKRTISQVGCGTQIFFSLTLGIAECLLLTLMSYDRYVAICNPLRYSVIMSHNTCKKIVIVSWAGGAITSLGHTAYAMHFPICRPREIPHFLCEVMALLKLTCEDISAYVKSVVVSSFLVVLIPLGLILASYTFIFFAVFHMNSPEGKNKALATCSSHLCVVSLYFGPAILVYMRPESSKTPKLNQSLFMFNAILTPMLNPLIYSLRNKDVIAALKSIIISRCSLQKTKSHLGYYT
ncbi:Olfactory receptor 2AJ1 [Galemys pyrenaicus]|uniref:Olfactory receptor 2AJ1 n=1 Tax=Galemys pyrenaicus TaxID=202257 RepID=A0A8J6DUI8_GALPY|nr:Olfactory receptor 2AJ1 [Galemys pyrenaicus]